jgi:ATP-dependent Lon protease
VSLLSALTLIPLAPRVALSGEITLTGQVLAVGGLKEKLLAALREGVRKVVLPADVRPQIQEVPRELTRGLEIVYVSEFKDVLPHVLYEECVPSVADVHVEGPVVERAERRKGG